MPHSARVTHHIQGRIRVKVPSAKGNEIALHRIKESILPMPGVRDVQVNSSTGSILVHYDSGLYDDFHQHLTEHGESAGLFALQCPEVSEIDQIANTIEREAEFLAARSETARTLVDFTKQLNSAIKKATRNAVDLNVLLPLGLAAYSVLELEAEMSTPLWVTLGIFSFNSFVMLHAGSVEQPVKTQEIIDHTDLEHPAQIAPPPRKRVSRKRAAS